MEQQSDQFAMPLNFEKFRLLQERLKEKIEEKEIPILKDTNIFCSWCNGELEEEIFYYCIYHRNVFCLGCVEKYHRSECSYISSPKCRTPRPKDCIYERKELIKSKDLIQTPKFKLKQTENKNFFVKKINDEKQNDQNC